MKLKITLLFAFVMLAITNTYAGFPVQRTVSVTMGTDLVEENNMDSEVLTSPAAQIDRKTTAILLWAFLGFLAVHRFYLGSPLGWNVLFILTGGFLVVGWIIDGVDIITGSYPGL